MAVKAEDDLYRAGEDDGGAGHDADVRPSQDGHQADDVEKEQHVHGSAEPGVEPAEDLGEPAVLGGLYDGAAHQPMEALRVVSRGENMAPPMKKT